MDHSGDIVIYKIYISLIILFLAGSAGATTLTIEDSNGANFMKILDVINNVSTADTIFSSSLSIEEAEDNIALNFSSGGDALWFGQDAVSYFGGDAAQTGRISDSQSTWVQTNVTDMEMLSFFWKVSSESGFDVLEFYIDGMLKDSISGEVNWTKKSYSISTGNHTLKWSYRKDFSASAGNDAGWIDKIEFPPSVPIEEAVENTAINFTSGGNALWFGQDEVSYFGGDAAQSGRISDSQSTWVQTNVTNIELFSFYWKVSTSIWDYLEFYIDGVLIDSISGEVNWTKKSYSIGSGNHTLKWMYTKDGSGSAGSDTGWIDKIAENNNNRPDLPTNLIQYRSDEGTDIPIGGTTSERTVVIKGGISDPYADTVQLEVEIKPVGIAFANIPTCNSSAVPSESTGSASCSSLANGKYHWQARAKDSQGFTGIWQSFGGNPESDPDFIVSYDPIIWTVDDSGGADYTKIQDAIDNAIYGDIILVYSGTYYENVIVTKQLTLRGIGMPVLDASGSGIAITLAADGIILEGFNVTRDWYYPEVGIKVTSNNNTLSRNNASNNDDGILLDSSSSNNTLIGNNASNNNFSGIFLYGSRYNTLINNIAYSNGNGIELSGGSSNNTLKENIADYNIIGIYLLQSYTNTLISNKVSENSQGIILRSSTNNMLIENIISNNYEGIRLDFTWEGVFDPGPGSRGNRLIGNSVHNSSSWIGISLNQACITFHWDGWDETKCYYISGNTLYMNDLVNNIPQDLGSNGWDNGMIGNHFFNFDEPSEGCIDTDDNGICDSSYHIPGSSSLDRYPLVSWNIDIAPPGSIDNLENISFSSNYINFTWTNPPDPDFHQVMLYLNGSFKTSILAPQNYYNFTGLDPDTFYELGTHTVDSSGNINETWVNKTARTAPSVLIPIQITNPDANPAIILNDNGRARPPGTNITRLNVTVTGNVASVNIDLSPIGRSATSPMPKISGTDIFTLTSNATACINMNLTHHLVVNVTDINGIFNDSVSIPLTVLMRGDINSDCKIDLKDLLFQRRYLAILEPSINSFVADIKPAEGDGNVDLKDLLYLRRYLAGLETWI